MTLAFICMRVRTFCFSMLVFMTLNGMSQIKYNVVGFSSEIGPGTGFVIDYWKSFNEQFELPKKPTIGLNISYDHFTRFMGRGGISLGVGLNATSFSQAVIFQNLPKTGNLSPEKHEFGNSRNYYLNIDLPVRYYLSYSVGQQWIFSPYVGLKVRSIAYIGNEGRETTVGGGYYNTNGVDTLFFIRYTIEYSSYSSRVLFLPHTGIQFSKQLSSGNTLNYFVEYNPGSLNAAEFRYMNFDNVENNVAYPELAEKTMRFRIRPAHVRFGFSYSFNKTRNR